MSFLGELERSCAALETPALVLGASATGNAALLSRLDSTLGADSPKSRIEDFILRQARIEHAIVIVDAIVGPTPSTRDQLYALHKMGVPHIIIAVDHIEAAGYEYEVFKTAVASVASIVSALGFQSITTIPVSGEYGDNVCFASDRTAEWYAGPTLAEALKPIRTNA